MKAARSPYRVHQGEPSQGWRRPPGERLNRDAFATPLAAAARPRRNSTPRVLVEPSLKAKLRQGDENTFGTLWHSAAAGNWFQH